MRRYSIDDSPYTTNIQLEEGAAGKTDIGAIVVMDGISDASVRTDCRRSPNVTPRGDGGWPESYSMRKNVARSKVNTR